ncbi:Rec8 like protein-domain-containing protein [Phakopsora pachyrhizi]|uniref:Rec8 like protein-domain-containing protein n=1 Tax=Phakopsora pachyrhizi TaxID=170000 RepID=A0AAV0AX35_PHAPC|nr:Rec8 like protein-domain-containing protein [Phakopsora pachyrhizi]
MFFSTEMLSKRGPLAKVWLAAHVERKVSKAQTLQTSIPGTVTVILEPTSTSVSTPPLALRLSGQLLLGIARIYSKQTKYLLEDCNEAWNSNPIEDQINGVDDHLMLQNINNPGANRDAINLKTTVNRNLFEFELKFDGALGFGFDDHWDSLDDQPYRGSTPSQMGIPGSSRSRIDADIGDITLAEPHSMLGINNHSDLGLDDLMEEEVGLLGDGLGFDLGLDLEDLDEPRQPRRRRENRGAEDQFGYNMEGDETMEVEIGRDAPGTVDRRSARDSIAPDLSAAGMDTSLDKTFESNNRDGDISLGVENENIDFEKSGVGQNFFPENFGDQNLDLGLDVGLNDENMAGPDEQQPARNYHKGQPPKKRLRHQLVDLVTELDPADHPSSSLAPNSELAATASSRSRFLPEDRYQLEYYRLSLDPSHHELLPKLLEVDGRNWLMAAPIGVCKELQDLFRFPTDGKPTSLTSGSKKRAREDDDQIEEEEAEDVPSEQGRRAQSIVPDADETFSRMGGGADNTFDLGGGVGEDSGMFGGGEDFRFEAQVEREDHQPTEDEGRVERDEIRTGNELNKVPSPPLEQRLPKRAPRAKGETSKLDIFDEPGNTQPSQNNEAETERNETGVTKWSKNTVKALTVLRDELDDEDDVFGFKDVSQKATRKASSNFFFELLVLATRDCLKVEQTESYGEISVKGRSRLWEVIDQEGLKV